MSPLPVQSSRLFTRCNSSLWYSVGLTAAQQDRSKVQVLESGTKESLFVGGIRLHSGSQRIVESARELDRGRILDCPLDSDGVVKGSRGKSADRKRITCIQYCSLYASSRKEICKRCYWRNR